MLKVFIVIATIFVLIPTPTKAATACLDTPGQQCWFNKSSDRDDVCANNCYGNDRFSYLSGRGTCYCCRRGCSNRSVCQQNNKKNKIATNQKLSAASVSTGSQFEESKVVILVYHRCINTAGQNCCVNKWQDRDAECKKAGILEADFYSYKIRSNSCYCCRAGC